MISKEENRRKAIAADAARPRLGEARAAVVLAEAQVNKTQVNISRMVVRAPIAGQVLQSDVRPGEYAASGPLAKPLMLLGNVEPLHVRVDVDEQDTGRVRAGAPATASPRGDATRRLPLVFVRFEPFVLPKSSLTGDSTERVDTRVLQVIYRVEAPGNDPRARFFVGQQMDVFIDPPTGRHRLRRVAVKTLQECRGSSPEPSLSAYLTISPCLSSSLAPSLKAANASAFAADLAKSRARVTASSACAVMENLRSSVTARIGDFQNAVGVQL